MDIFLKPFLLLLEILFLRCEKKETTAAIRIQQPEISTPPGMVWISGGRFQQGAVAGDKNALDHYSGN